jgi:chemotaxis protein MotB
MTPEAPIIIKKKVVHGGHHGGAWKVAYADFVTAMMALFIVLWLMNSNKQVQHAVAGYFKDPSGKAKDRGSGTAGTGEDLADPQVKMKELKLKIEELLKGLPGLVNIGKQVEMTITPEGLRIELLEEEQGTFFETGNAHPSTAGAEMLYTLAGELGKVPNRLLIEGHTDSRPYSGGVGGYSNWDLAADRANAARRHMEQKGLRAGQVAEVRGYADQRLHKPAEPAHSSNRRVSIVVRYGENKPG